MKRKQPHTSIITAPRFLLALCSFLLLIHLAEATPPPGYTLVWADEFNGHSLNVTNWSYRQLGTRNDAVNVLNAVAVTNGTLTLTTYTQNGTNYTGMIGTDGKYAPRYGYLEASIKWSDSPGEWSAFWMQNNNMSMVENPHTNGTEIDIVEHRAHNHKDKDFSDQAVSNIHWDGYGVDAKSVGSGPVGSGLAIGFHVYALEWTPDLQIFYIDGVRMYSVTNSDVMDPIPPAVAVSQANEYIILSSEVHDMSWAGTVPAGGYGSQATSITKMAVEYLRVYQLTVPVLPVSITSATRSNDEFVITGTNLNGGQSFHYVVLSSTNLSLPLVNWTVLATNSSSADGTFRYTNTFATAINSIFYDVKTVP